MVKTRKRGTAGNVKNYITRAQAVRKLQISLPDFRRLCIFKGIYPREPRSKKRASKSSTPSTTFYYAKDIQFLLHEPLLSKFRDQKSLAKKISKALGRNEVSDASRLERNLTPRIRLDHIIKERYPTFVDALRDLDDALSLLFLFANLPGSENVPPKIIAKCQRLTMEFEHYLIRTHSLRRSFLSIKGIYYQATIQGQDILWLAPYKFVQRTAADVDYRIMATFVEFYTTLLGFVNYRLYSGIGLVYPPKFDARSEEQGAELGAFRLQGPEDNETEETAQIPNIEQNTKAQSEADKLLALPSGDEEAAEVALNRDSTNIEPSNVATGALDQFAPIDPNADALLQPSVTADSTVAAQLFEPFTVYLSRETPRHPLEFILRAFGCKRIAFDSLDGEAGSYCAEDDKRITHQIVDRPELPLPQTLELNTEENNHNDDAHALETIRRSNTRVPDRIYIQPQWVWDSINSGTLLQTYPYAPGATLPPHLSPWIKPKTGEYNPAIPLVDQQTAAEAEAEVFDEDEDEALDEDDDDKIYPEDDQQSADGDEISDADSGMDVALADSDPDSEPEEPSTLPSHDADWEGFSGDEAALAEEESLANDSARRAREHQAELEAEAAGLPLPTANGTRSSAPRSSSSARAVSQAKRSKAEREAAEDVERRKMLMSRRKRKMYEKMVYSNAKKDEEAEKLRAKRRKIEKELAKPKA